MDRQTIDQPVTVTVARRIAPGGEARFERWAERLTRAAARFPGFLGAGLLKPGSAVDDWHVVYRFDTAEHLAAWEDSAERARLLSAGDDLVEATDIHRVTGLETWFQQPGDTHPAPPRWKMFLVTVAAIYLLQLVVNALLGRVAGDWPTPVRLFAFVAVTSALMTWVVMPRAARWLARWLYRG